MLKTQAEEFRAKLGSYTNLADARGIDSSKFRSVDNIKNNGNVTGIGIDFVFTTKAFMLPLNKISEPIRGERGYYIMYVKASNIPDEGSVTKGLPKYMLTLRQQTQAQAYTTWFRKINEDAVVVDNRSKYYRKY